MHSHCSRSGLYCHIRTTIAWSIVWVCDFLVWCLCWWESIGCRLRSTFPVRTSSVYHSDRWCCKDASINSSVLGSAFLAFCSHLTLETFDILQSCQNLLYLASHSLLLVSSVFSSLPHPALFLVSWVHPERSWKPCELIWGFPAVVVRLVIRQDSMWTLLGRGIIGSVLNVTASSFSVQRWVSGRKPRWATNVELATSIYCTTWSKVHVSRHCLYAASLHLCLSHMLAKTCRYYQNGRYWQLNLQKNVSISWCG